MVCGGDDKGEGGEPKLQARVVKIGAVAYSPSAVTIFDGVCRYLNRNGLTADYVLYSNYDSLVDALQKRQIDIAWNTPLANAQYHKKAGDKSQTLVMRDVIAMSRTVLIARTDANIRSLADLKDKTLVLGSRQGNGAASPFPRERGNKPERGQDPQPGWQGRLPGQSLLQRGSCAQSPRRGHRTGWCHRRSAFGTTFRKECSPNRPAVCSASGYLPRSAIAFLQQVPI